ncbi:MAG: hypothetical protein H0X26_04690 [Alphaproteobacteria bacterium]|nr:hypothetical protein [Alphaproteobacteria bacterium]
MKTVVSFLFVSVAMLFWGERKAHSDLCDSDCKFKLDNCKLYECGAFVGGVRDRCEKKKCGEFSAYSYKECIDKCRGYDDNQPNTGGSSGPNPTIKDGTSKTPSTKNSSNAHSNTDDSSDEYPDIYYSDE